MVFAVASSVLLLMNMVFAVASSVLLLQRLWKSTTQVKQKDEKQKAGKNKNENKITELHLTNVSSNAIR